MLARDESVRLLLNLFLAAPVQVSAKVLTFSTRGVESKALLVIFSSCHGVIIVHLAWYASSRESRRSQLYWIQHCLRLTLYFSDAPLNRAEDTSCCAVRITLTLQSCTWITKLYQTDVAGFKEHSFFFLIPFLKMTNYRNYLVSSGKEVT